MPLDVVREQIVTCTRCPRLRAYCDRIAREKKDAHRTETYWGKPVPGFGDPRARLFIIGLAPAAHGANRTGRMFTGDGPGGAGDFLMTALHACGFANMATSRHRDDGLVLHDAYVACAARCAPPDNKPTPAELSACLPHLQAEIAELANIRVVVALGRIGFEAYLRLLDRKWRERPRPSFGHGRRYEMEGAPTLIASYHPSRQNTNTGKLTAPMLEAVFREARSRRGGIGSRGGMGSVGKTGRVRTG
jgi:uracil-DNA glycosylase family 4